MAVKQNNSEPNDATDGVNSASGGASNGAMPPNSKQPASSNIKISDDGGGGGGAGGGGESMDTNGTGPSETNDNGGQPLNAVTKRDIQELLSTLQNLDKSEHSLSVLSFYKRMIIELARMKPEGRTSEDLLRFKEEAMNFGTILATANEKNYLMYFLLVVYDLITKSGESGPSYAVAVVFHLFSPRLINEAVQSLLDTNVEDTSIRKTVVLLCEWVCVCNFCPNLNLWVMALLTGLRDQGKHVLLDDIALDSIEKLFNVIMLPAMRPKAAPIVFHMLSNINQTPEIFRKILPRIPTVLNLLKQQFNITDEFGGETRQYMQQLVDLTSVLMMRFNENSELYASVRVALQMYEPSPNCGDLARAMQENALATGRRNARVGLVNLGNTCYMNSVLQALAMTSDFSRQILLLQSDSLLLLKVQQQIALMHHSMRCELTPSRVLNATRPPGFTPGLQQDSSEFLGYLLDLLHEQEIKKDGGHSLHGKDVDAPGELNDEILSSGVIPYNSNDREIAGGSNGSSSTSARLKPTSTPTKGTNSSQQQPQLPKKPTSTIDKTFTGKLSTTYNCLDCSWESHIEDSFRELQLSFPDDKDDCSATNYSVQDLIEYYCSPEKLDGENQYFCPRCKKLCDADRRIGVTEAPRNLVLTLKQFKYDQKYHFRTKLMHKVFHDESLVVKICSSDSLQEQSAVYYEMYAGVVHSGYHMDSGHYFTFAADQSRNWYKFNDNFVTHSQSEEMHNLTSPNTPYILFYKMCGRSHESSPTGTEMVSVPQVPPLTLEELPGPLRDYVKKDNRLYSEELRSQRFAGNNGANGHGFVTRNRYDGDDEDDRAPPPSGGCGGNDLGMNVNRFVY
ncbi:ubiquitin carboxyl-terminal hydrolase 38 [Drosophila guanche]|uniref:Blast:Ubiquitin carboxyl-terminal hydrolase 38 n=1 Tax=Drosophila guanche TaxID=7266 RepID=A0A3B0J1Q7_DROGU|nr:ubiquitin carboxyl-terminal hydrolase 38 [Drosophila guanche]SPP75184.1 blast:Ubiquitin carboxyl-terminal hydrolase 38 [Drosophila guanche]